MVGPCAGIQVLTVCYLVLTVYYQVLIVYYEVLNVYYQVLIVRICSQQTLFSVVQSVELSTTNPVFSCSDKMTGCQNL